MTEQMVRPSEAPERPTRALLVCGAVAGPVYVAVTLAQALTRAGFDLRQHRFSLLTAGDLGWVHRSNMLLVGVLTVLAAVGVGRVLRSGRGAVWGPRLIGLYGVVYVVGGLLTADPVVGFPVGTTAEAVRTTWQGAVQNASRGVGTLVLLAASAAVAGWFAAQRRRGWAWTYLTAIPVGFAALTAVGLVIGGNPTALAFLVTPWAWITALAVHLLRGGAVRRGGAGRPGRPAARGREPRPWPSRG